MTTCPECKTEPVEDSDTHIAYCLCPTAVWIRPEDVAYLEEVDVEDDD